VLPCLTLVGALFLKLGVTLALFGTHLEEL
jgi:hypothetical protein